MTIEELLALYNPQVRATAEKARALVLDVFPDALEQVDAPDKMIHYGLGTKMAQQVFYIAGYTSTPTLASGLAAALATRTICWRAQANDCVTSNCGHPRTLTGPACANYCKTRWPSAEQARNRRITLCARSRSSLVLSYPQYLPA